MFHMSPFSKIGVGKANLLIIVGTVSEVLLQEIGPCNLSEPHISSNTQRTSHLRSRLNKLFHVITVTVYVTCLQQMSLRSRRNRVRFPSIVRQC